MTALIWMLAWLPQVLSAMSELPSPVKLTLNSSNFIHLLKWEPGPGTPRGVHYSVHAVHTDTGLTWLPVDGCQHVRHPLVCNLTETFSDRFGTYCTKVTAGLEGRTSNSSIINDFQPNRDTHLDLPLLSVTPCDKYLCVDLQSPFEHLREFYNASRYKLRLQYNRVEKKKDTRSLERVKFLEYVLPGKKYCVSVRFSDDTRPDYSRPVCYLSPSLFNTNALIASLLCLLVMIGVVITALLFSAGYSAGYICLRRKHLPRVLTSIHHLDEVLVVSPRSTPLSFLLNLRPTPPSSGEDGSKQTLSEDSDEESEAESSGGGGYKLRVGTNLVSSSSSSSSCLAAPLPPAPEPTPGFSSNQTSDSPTHTTSQSEPLPECVSDPPADSLTGGSEPNKKEEEEEEEEEVNLLTLTFGRQEEEDVNLLTLTFGRREEEEEDLHDEISAILPAQTQDAEEEVALKSCAVDEEDEEEEEEEEEDEEDDCGYMRRPPPHVLQNLK